MKNGGKNKSVAFIILVSVYLNIYIYIYIYINTYIMSTWHVNFVICKCLSS